VDVPGEKLPSQVSGALSEYLSSHVANEVTLTAAVHSLRPIFIQNPTTPERLSELKGIFPSISLLSLFKETLLPRAVRCHCLVA